MNIDSSIIIRKERDYAELKKILASITKPDRRLPDQVFREGFNNFMFEEFDWIMSGKSWEAIQQLAIKSKDSLIILEVLEPNPTEYFFQEFGYYNWLKIPTKLTRKEYFEVLQYGPPNSPADAVLYNSEIVVWLSPSMKWAIWGQRSYGICVIGFKLDSEELIKSDFLNSWRSANQVTVDLLPSYFKEEKVLKEFANVLCLNYSNK